MPKKHQAFYPTSFFIICIAMPKKEPAHFCCFSSVMSFSSSAQQLQLLSRLEILGLLLLLDGGHTLGHGGRCLRDGVRHVEVL